MIAQSLGRQRMGVRKSRVAMQYQRMHMKKLTDLAWQPLSQWPAMHMLRLYKAQ